MSGRMAGRALIVAGALGVLIATAGVVALARAITDVPGSGGVPQCASSATDAPAGDVAGPVAVTPAVTSAQAEDYWTPERMRNARGTVQGGNDGPTPTCR